MANSPFVIEVSERTFAQEVIEKSKQTPVVVDFWAAWCGPCRTLGPILERLAGEFQGAFILAKLDVDRNQRLSQQYGQQALNKQPDHALAILGLARIRVAQGRIGEAEALVERLPPASPQAADARRLLIRARWRAEASQLGNEADLLTRLAHTDNGLADRIALGKLRLSQERYAEGLGLLLDAVRADRRFQDGAARKAMLDAFAFLGDESPLTVAYRRQLSNALF